jgi:uncharacterized membrane protein YeaQ/YmgE (transglycosylase-associated protein family)
MIGMNFVSFLTLLVVSFIVAAIMQYAIRYRVMRGVDGFAAKWIAGWIGAWVGSPVLGHWSANVQNTYVIPAIIGALVGSFLIAYVAKVQVVSSAAVPASAVTSAAPELLRKAV